MAQIKINNIIYGTSDATDIIYNNITVAEKLDTVPIFDIEDNTNVSEAESNYLTYGHIIDGLNSDATDKVLSANQGKILNEKINNIDLSYLENGIDSNTESINSLSNNINTDLSTINNTINENIRNINTNTENIQSLTTKTNSLNDVLLTKANSAFAESYFGSVNLNDYIKSGMYRLNDNHINMPSGASGYGQLLVIFGGGDTIAQIYFQYNSTTFYLRVGNPINNSSGSWTPWRAI